jgi:hypothetical protein
MRRSVATICCALLAFLAFGCGQPPLSDGLDARMKASPLQLTADGDTSGNDGDDAPVDAEDERVPRDAIVEGTEIYDPQLPDIPFALSWGLPMLSGAFDFLDFSWILELGGARVNTGPRRYLEPAEHGFFGGETLTSQTLASSWPFYEKLGLLMPVPWKRQQPADPPVVRRHYAWPFLTTEEGPDHRVVNMRPLFFYGRSGDRKDVRVLYPLFRHRTGGGNARSFIFPIYYRDYRERQVGDRTEFDLDAFILPFFFWGDDSREGRYFAFFPFGGIVKGILGKRWIRFVMFPLWVEARDPQYKSINVLWPVFGIWRGVRQHGWRFWPFYGTNTYEGKFRRQFWLWPLFHYWTFGQDTRYPGYLHAFFPFYLRKHSIDRETNETRQSVWNFLLLFQWRYHAERNWREIHAPWPIFSWAKAHGLRVFKLWPIYGHRQSNWIRHRFILWPVYRFILNRTPANLKRRWSVLFIFNITKNEWIETIEQTDAGPRIRRTAVPRSEREGWIEDPRPEVQVLRLKESLYPTTATGAYRRNWTVSFWPLFWYRKGPYGGVIFRSLNLLPTERGSELAANWLPFTILYHYQRTFEGIKESRALLGWYRHRSSPVSRWLNGLGIFDYRRLGNKDMGVHYRKVSFLKGLVGYERAMDDSRFKLLWIPLGGIDPEKRAAARQKQNQAILKMVKDAQQKLLTELRPPVFDWKKAEEALEQGEREIQQRRREDEPPKTAARDLPLLYVH